jgi:hypothetical protein
MKASVGKRLSWIELVLSGTDEPEPVTIDLSVFSDAELERLEWFAERLAAWSGGDWIESGLGPEERIELDGLLARVN